MTDNAINMDDYRMLDPASDLEKSVIHTKLHTIVRDIPEEFQNEYFDCFLYSFLSMGNAHYQSEEEGKQTQVAFFSKQPQNHMTHMLAYTCFSIIVYYAGNLGRLMSEEGKTEEEKNELLGTAVEVFKGGKAHYNRLIGASPEHLDYEGLIGGLPIMERDDLIQFQDALKIKINPNWFGNN